MWPDYLESIFRLQSSVPAHCQGTALDLKAKPLCQFKKMLLTNQTDLIWHRVHLRWLLFRSYSYFFCHFLHFSFAISLSATISEHKSRQRKISDVEIDSEVWSCHSISKLLLLEFKCSIFKRVIDVWVCFDFSTTTDWIDMKFVADMSDCQRMHPKHSGDHLTFHWVKKVGCLQKFWRSHQPQLYLVFITGILVKGSISH